MEGKKSEGTKHFRRQWPKQARTEPWRVHRNLLCLSPLLLLKLKFPSAHRPGNFVNHRSLFLTILEVDKDPRL
jgi:hypothetical protein